MNNCSKEMISILNRVNENSSERNSNGFAKVRSSLLVDLVARFSQKSVVESVHQLVVQEKVIIIGNKINLNDEHCLLVKDWIYGNGL